MHILRQNVMTKLLKSAMLQMDWAFQFYNNFLMSMSEYLYPLYIHIPWLGFFQMCSQQIA